MVVMMKVLWWWQRLVAGCLKSPLAETYFMMRMIMTMTIKRMFADDNHGDNDIWRKKKAAIECILFRSILWFIFGWHKWQVNMLFLCLFAFQICEHLYLLWSHLLVFTFWIVSPSHLFAWKVLYGDVNDMQHQLKSKPAICQIQKHLHLHFDQNVPFSLSTTGNAKYSRKQVQLL